jgi:chorismate dehydratase
MPSIRLGAVGFLNARPLTWALDRTPGVWQIRYDVPSVCSARLHAGEVDLGLVPSIDYAQADYRLVPGVGICSRGAVSSVALYARRPVAELQRIAIDTSSRTSVALLRVLCRHRFGIDPEFVPHPPDLATMVRDHDAGLLIGDPAFEADPSPLGVSKLDLGEEWTAMTGLPFVYAAWAGRPDAVAWTDVRALQAAQTAGVAAIDSIAEEYGRGDQARTVRAAVYLRDNVCYGLGPEEVAGLQTFLEHAADLDLVPARRPLAFYEETAPGRL